MYRALCWPFAQVNFILRAATSSCSSSLSPCPWLSVVNKAHTELCKICATHPRPREIHLVLYLLLTHYSDQVVWKAYPCKHGLTYGITLRSQDSGSSDDTKSNVAVPTGFHFETLGSFKFNVERRDMPWTETQVNRPDSDLIQVLHHCKFTDFSEVTPDPPQTGSIFVQTPRQGTTTSPDPWEYLIRNSHIPLIHVSDTFTDSLPLALQLASHITLHTELMLLSSIPRYFSN